MPNVTDWSNKKIGRLTVIGPAGRDKYSHRLWLCKCDCGNTVTRPIYNCLANQMLSCGCLNKEAITKHGLKKHRLYNILVNMHERCYLENNKCYKDYGGREITICDEWNKKVIGMSKAIQNFYNWAVNNGYKDDLTIDRIDVNGNYEPNNCRWTTWKVQQNNRRNTKFITFMNQKMTINEASEKFNIDTQRIWQRLRNGWSIEKTLLTPVKRRVRAK